MSRRRQPTDTVDVLLASMPFAPAHLPTIGIELLKAAVPTRRTTTVYFTVEYLRRFGPSLYRTIVDRHASLLGEWVFAPALFDAAPACDDAFLERLARRDERRITQRQLELLRRARMNASAFIEACADDVLCRQPTLVGLTSVFQQHIATLALARRLKTRRPSLVIVVGGANCEGTMGVETARSFPFLDAVVSGEADHIFAGLVDRALEGRPLDDLPGVITPTAAAAGREAVQAPPVMQLDGLPVPSYDDYFAQWDRARVTWDVSAKVPFETSRGCWWGAKHHCTFCGLNAKSMTFRSKSADRVLTELTHLVGRYPGRPVMVVDNILDMRYFQDVLPALAARKLPVSLFFEVKANLKRDQLQLMHDAGIRDIQPGIESLSRPILSLMRKGVTPLQNIQLLKWCAEIGIFTHWNWLWGFPGEPPEEYARMATIVPRLTHLQPPKGYGLLRLDRFSPNFTDSEALGFTNIRPAHEYFDVYPLPADAVANLAYYFTGTYRDGRDPVTYVEPLRAALAGWHDVYHESELIAFDRDNETWLFDSRPAYGGLTALDGLDRALYRACDTAQSFATLARLASAQAARDIAPAEVQDRLAPYLERGLLIEEDGQVLALAVTGTGPSAGDVAHHVQSMGVRVAGKRALSTR